MKVKFYGVRGSLPICGTNFQKYGGNTTCIVLELEQKKRIIIIDAGTGIRSLGKDIVAPGTKGHTINLSFTHFHWDHIQGFPFFAPAYNPENILKVHVMGCDRKYLNLKEIFSQQMQEEYFPVALNEMGATFEFL